MRVVERYDSVQGTGTLAGTPQHFVRLAGCSVRCPIRSVCDEPQSLDPDAGQERSIEDVLKVAGMAGWIHVSGGEPLEQLDEVARLSRLRPTHVQTSGMVDEGAVVFGFVTCSPKGPADHLKLRWCNELVVVAAPWVRPEHLKGFSRRYENAHRFVMPLWEDSLSRCQELMAAVPGWRLAIQAHKFWGMK